VASSIIMPKTGIAQEEGTIVRWLKHEGDAVEKGDVIAEIETDKTTMELEAEAAGVILRLIHADGETVPVSRVIGWIGKKGEAIPQDAAGAGASAGAGPAEAARAPAVSAAAGAAESPKVADGGAAAGVAGKVAATPSARRLAAEKKVDLAAVTPTGKHGEVRERDVQALGSVAVSPLAKKIAAETGIELAGVKGTGPGGRITKADLPSATAEGRAASAVAAEPAAGDQRVPLTQIQKITGRRVLQSHLEIPPVTCQTKADVSELLLVREKLNAAADRKATINDWVLKAVAKTLQANPRVNSVLDGTDVVYRRAIDIGMAVATPRGLLVPVVRGVDSLTLGDLAAATRDLSTRAKEGKLAPRDMEAGTFSVSNMGMLGITAFTPIINQPQVAILGVCSIEQELRLDNGQVAAHSMIGLSLTFDHRVLDGAEAALFLKSMKELLENPLVILF
jgi:pyruvate dehydrogenase E2 component (dihydrolipoamide acetyltransferase)